MIHTGDCVEVMAQMEPESVDAIVTEICLGDKHREGCPHRTCDDCAGPGGCWEDPRSCAHTCHGPWHG